MIVSVGLEEYIEELLIDDQRNFTPHRAISKNKSLVYTDHYSMLLKFKNIPMRKKSFKKVDNPVIWNTHKEGGWERYLTLTTNSTDLEKIAEMAPKLDSEEIMTKFTTRMEKIKF